MRRMGRYKTLTLSFGFLPFLASVLLARLEEGSSQAHQWLTIVRMHGANGVWTYNNFVNQIPLGFGNGVVLQTMYGKLPLIFFCSFP